MEKRRKRWLWITSGALVVALLLGGYIHSRRRSAEVLSASVGALDLAWAIEQYYSEYGKLPETGASDFTTDSPAGHKLLVALIGDNRNGEGVRALCLLRSTEEDLARTPEDRVARGYADPWGNPFRVIFDDDFDERITVNLGQREIEISDVRVLVLSRGRDGIEGTSDDIQSWTPTRPQASALPENRR